MLLDMITKTIRAKVVWQLHGREEEFHLLLGRSKHAVNIFRSAHF